VSRAPTELESLLGEIRACRICEASLPMEPRPILRANASARLLVVGQAPGTLVHGSGIPFSDASGMRLRGWLGLDRDAFYDEAKVAIVPMGFCYPGRGASGDLPPRPECSRTWHHRLLPLLPNVQLVLAIGQYAQVYFLGDQRKKTLTDTVMAWRDYAPRHFPLPHPSPRNVAWFRHNAWFDDEVVPALRKRVEAALGDSMSDRSAAD
jgi:uracil-DNA glycosylase